MKRITPYLATFALGIAIACGVQAVASKPTTLEFIPVKLKTYNATMQYLAGRPYAEVYQLVAALSQDGEIANKKAQEAEGKKGDKKK